MLGIPSPADVRAWVGVSASSLPDDDLTRIIGGELDLQAKNLRIPADPQPDGTEATYPPALVTALLRRVQRSIAARDTPLGFVADNAGEFGALYLRSWDPEIRRLEDPYRIPVVA